MSNKYTHNDKKRLADKISTIKKKEYLFRILNIIKDETNSITSNNNGLFMYFHNLSDITYDKISDIIEEYDSEYDCLDKEYKIFVTKASYKPYSTDDLPSQTTMSPKLKYSNKERNLLKRKHYDSRISSDTSDIYYENFDVIDSTKSSNSNPNSNSDNA